MSDQGAPQPGQPQPGQQQSRRGPMNRDGVRLGQFLGVPILVQPIWIFVVIVIAVSFGPEIERQVPSRGHASAYAVSLVFVLLLYASVLVHEISHVAVAKALGMEVRRIVLQL